MKSNEPSASACPGLDALFPKSASPETEAAGPSAHSLRARTRRPKVKLRRAAVDDALASWTPGRRLRVFFEDPKGLFLNITPNGAAAYYFRFARGDGTWSETAIGPENQLTPSLAADEATRLFSEMRLSRVNPVAAKRQRVAEAKAAKAQTFGALTEAFLAASENTRVSERTAETRQWLLDKHILPRIKAKPVAELDRAAIRACVREVQAGCQTFKGNPEKSGHRTANACRAMIARILEWAVEEEIIPGNPAARMKKMFDDTPARRVNRCNDDILRAFWSELEDGDIQRTGKATALCCQLIMLTLQRPNEVTKAHRADFHFDKLLWLPRESLTKTNTLYRVCLTPWTKELFEKAFELSGCDWAFPGLDGEPMEAHVTNRFWQRVRARLIKDGKLSSADITLYDCSRRFGRTCLEETLGFREAVAEAVINHADPGQTMRRRYNVSDMLPELRRAHEAWQAEVRRITGSVPRPDNVMSFTGHGAKI